MNLKRMPPVALIAWALPVLVILLLASWWMIAWNDASDRLARAQDQIRRVAWIADHAADLQQRLTQSDTDPLAGDYLPAASDEDATANLQRMVKQAIDQSNAGILSAQPLPATTDGDFKAVAARFQVNVTPSGLVSLLTTLANNRPFIFVDSAEIFAMPSGSPAQPVGDPSQRLLTLQFDVRAIMMTDAHD